MKTTPVTRSGLEQEILLDLQKQNVPFEYESEVLLWMSEHKYTPDFIIQTRTGKKIYIEAKGYFPGPQRGKMRAVKKQNPDIDLRMVFENPHQRISKKSKTTYAGWADKFGFKWARYRCPKEWIDE